MKQIRNWTVARLGFRYTCDKCVASGGATSKKLGKFWQAMYGESARQFKPILH